VTGGVQTFGAAGFQSIAWFLELLLLWFEVTRHPTAEWLARQITEAFPWTSSPTYLVRDNEVHTDMSSPIG
jgi:hypothetical protein